MKSVFIISTASQAFFLSLTPELVENAILILTVKNSKEEKKILEYTRNLKWEKKMTWYIPKSNSFSEYLKFAEIRVRIFFFKIHYPDIEKVYIGSYVNQYHRSFLAEFEGRSASYLLYDGLQIISTAYSRKSRSLERDKNPLLMRLLNFKSPDLSSLIYVSPISLDIPERDQLYVVGSYRTALSVDYDKDEIYFIGQPISNIGVLNHTFYIEVLELIKRRYQHAKLVYVPHPREKKETLDSIRKVAEIMQPNVIFEKYFLSSSNFPHKVFSFYSSVLLNLIFLKAECKIVSIRIPDSEIKSRGFAESINPIYDYFETIEVNNFTVLDIDDIR